MALIEAKNITKIYQMGETQVEALKGVSVTIEKGEFIAITGTSGSGKSTLMHLLGCLDTPTSGQFFLDGIDIARSTRDELAKIRNEKIGFVFQKFFLLNDLTALNNVALPQLYAGKTELVARQQATKLLEMVGLADRMNHYPYQLSGGQQQRVAIARSLVNNPSILFADEPTGNLDSKTGQTIMKMFEQLNKDKNVTIILVTHEQEIANYTRRVIDLIDGKIVKDGK